jgi:putative transposase
VKAGRNARAPWREKKCRPLSFSKGYGWLLTREGKLALSRGKGRDRILLPLPEVVSREGVPVGPENRGGIRLCWDRSTRRWSLHIAYHTPANALPVPVRDADGTVTGPVVTVAIDEGVIHPMALSAPMPDGSTNVLVINGRQGRSTKQWRNKQVARPRRKLARCQEGSRQHRRLMAAKKKPRAKTDPRLTDFDHR